MSLLTIFYWILILLTAIGIATAPNFVYWPRANAVIILFLFIILGIKLLKPTW